MVVRVGLKGKWHAVGILCIRILSSRYIGGCLVKFGQSRKYADFYFYFKSKILSLNMNCLILIQRSLMCWLYEGTIFWPHAIEIRLKGMNCASCARMGHVPIKLEEWYFDNQFPTTFSDNLFPLFSLENNNRERIKVQ